MAEEEAIKAQSSGLATKSIEKKATSSATKKAPATSALPSLNAAKVLKPTSSKIPPVSTPKTTVTRPPPPSQKPPTLQVIWVTPVLSLLFWNETQNFFFKSFSAQCTNFSSMNLL